jgi:hypothetical protein
MAFSTEDGDILSRLHSKDVDTMIANELSTMSWQEREYCYNDIHGVPDTIEETPEFVEEKVSKLVYEIAKISRNKKDAYLKAVVQDKEYATNKRFRLKFLRAELFNEKAAAQRLVLFFEEKLKLFKPELLAKDIKITDLDEDDRKCLESGVGQLVPQRDRAGRCVLAWIMTNTPTDMCDKQIAINRVSRNHIFCERLGRSNNLLLHHPHMFLLVFAWFIYSQCRVLYYLLMAASEDEETQKKGMVAVVITDGRNRSLNLESARRSPALSQGLPTRWNGVHFGVDNYLTAKAFSLFMVLLESRERARFRKHVGK